jgi:ribosome-associated translation inhibitor RaiA
MDVSALLIQKARTWKKFSSTERWFLLQALILLPAIALLLKLGVKRTHFLLSKFLTLELSSLHPTSQVLTTANMVKIAAKYYSWATCLKRAFVLWFLLRRQGIDAELKIGTRLGTEFQAHAWVEYQGFVVGEHQGVKQHYAAFDKLETKLSQNLSKVQSNRLTSPISKWRIEDELLLCYARTHIDNTTALRIETLQKEKNIDWKDLLQQASQQGVFLLLHQNLIINHLECMPKNIQPQLQAYSQIKTARNLFLSKKLCQILELFKNHDIQVIPFKGSVLAASVYNNLAIREFCDIDLLIKQEDFVQVKELLLAQNYKPRSELQPWGEDFASQDDKVHIDIHWQLAPSCFPYRLDFSDLWQRCQTISILNQKVITLSPEDSLLILCLQIVKDAHYRQEKLKQVCDIAELVRTSSLNWELVIQQSQNLSSERLLLFGLALAQQLLQVEIPLEIKQKIASDRIVNRYLSHVTEQLFTIDDRQKKIFGLFDRGLMPGLYGFTLRGLMLLDRSKFLGKHNRYLVGHLFSYMFAPNSRDLEYIYLPPYLYFLYYLIRPIRLISKLSKSSSKTNLILPN